MRTYLYFITLDEALFPELERPPGVYAIEATLVRPGTDHRIPVPVTSPAALVASYTLLASQVPAGAGLRLVITGVEPDGKPRTTELALLSPPPPGDNVLGIDPAPGPLPAGTVFRAIFWVDLAPLVREGMLRPGDTLTLQYGNAATRIALPGAAQSPKR